MSVQYRRHASLLFKVLEARQQLSSDSPVSLRAFWTEELSRESPLCRPSNENYIIQVMLMS